VEKGDGAKSRIVRDKNPLAGSTGGAPVEVERQSPQKQNQYNQFESINDNYSDRWLDIFVEFALKLGRGVFYTDCLRIMEVGVAIAPLPPRLIEHGFTSNLTQNRSVNSETFFLDNLKTKTPADGTVQDISENTAAKYKSICRNYQTNGLATSGHVMFCSEKFSFNIMLPSAVF